MTEENACVIASEHSNFNREEFRSWMREHGGGFFVRDPESAFDCKYFSDFVFFELYSLLDLGTQVLFQRIQRL